MVRMVFAEMQSFKGVKNYFIDSLLYKENGKMAEKPLLNDIDSGNKADLKLGDDIEVFFNE